MKRQTPTVQGTDRSLTLLCLFIECPDTATLIASHLFTTRHYLTKNRWDAIGFRTIYQFASVCKQTYYNKPFDSLLKSVQAIVLCDMCLSITRYICPFDACSTKLCKLCARKCLHCKRRCCNMHTRECITCEYNHNIRYKGDLVKLRPYYRTFYCEDCRDHGFPLYSSGNHDVECKYCVRDNRDDISDSEERAFEASFSYASDEEPDTESETSGLSQSNDEG